MKFSRTFDLWLTEGAHLSALLDQDPNHLASILATCSPSTDMKPYWLCKVGKATMTYEITMGPKETAEMAVKHLDEQILATMAEAEKKVNQLKSVRANLLAIGYEASPAREDEEWREGARTIITGCSLYDEDEGVSYWGDLWKGGGFYYFNCAGTCPADSMEPGHRIGQKEVSTPLSSPRFELLHGRVMKFLVADGLLNEAAKDYTALDDGIPF